MSILSIFAHPVQFSDWVFLIQSVLFIGCQVWDVLSTNAFLKAGIPEAGPIAKIAQAKLGKWWWVMKLPELLVVYVAACMPYAEAHLILGFLTPLYIMNNLNNSQR